MLDAFDTFLLKTLDSVTLDTLDSNTLETFDSSSQMFDTAGVLFITPSKSFQIGVFFFQQICLLNQMKMAFWIKIKEINAVRKEMPLNAKLRLDKRMPKTGLPFSLNWK